MAHYDLIIRGGTVVDGTGAEPFAADIAIKDGLIAQGRPCPRRGHGGD
jgi:N-acyl-D-amino-acid deacylase